MEGGESSRRRSKLILQDETLDKDDGMIFITKRYSNLYGECLLLFTGLSSSQPFSFQY